MDINGSKIFLSDLVRTRCYFVKIAMLHVM